MANLIRRGMPCGYVAVTCVATASAFGQGDDNANSAAFSTRARASRSIASSALSVTIFLFFSARAARAIGSFFFHSVSCEARGTPRVAIVAAHAVGQTFDEYRAFAGAAFSSFASRRARAREGVAVERAGAMGKEKKVSWRLRQPLGILVCAESCVNSRPLFSHTKLTAAPEVRC